MIILKMSRLAFAFAALLICIEANSTTPVHKASYRRELACAWRKNNSLPQSPAILKMLTQACPKQSSELTTATTSPQVDMEQPCTVAHQPECNLSIDVARPNLKPPSQQHTSCETTLMPWTPFPCLYGSSESLNKCTTDIQAPGYNQLFVSSFDPCSGTARVTKAVLSLHFKVAMGKQFDRMFTMFINNTMVALGTASEPSSAGAKFWNVDRDITHISPMIQSGSEVIFMLPNVLEPPYNVPIWANATLYLEYDDEVMDLGLHSEILPLMANDTAQSTILGLPGWVSISGNGGGPPWPNVTYDLPSSLSLDQNIVGASIEIFPKADACEEFWALNPSAEALGFPGTGSVMGCNGKSTGEPYREIRVFIDGELVAFSPIYITTYTGGVNPYLWSTIVAYSAYMLPSYRFNLGPWLSVLNSRGDHNVSIEIGGEKSILTI